MPIHHTTDGELHYALHNHDGIGQRTPVVLIHGAFCDSTDWTAQVEAVAARRPVVAIDLPGHGRSTEPDPAAWSVRRCAHAVRELLEHLGLGPVVVAGHSLGCRVCLELAYRFPALVSGLVLVDGSRLATAGTADHPLARALDRLGARGFVRALFDDMLLDGLPHPVVEMIFRRAAVFDEPLVSAVAKATLDWDAHQLPVALAQIDTPTTVVQTTGVAATGKRTKLRPSESTEWTRLLARHLPSSELIVLPDCGHFPMLERPAEVTDLLISHDSARLTI
ncbi:alpha/beta fold hydrolase [Amycolatopsis sp. GM8]|uniref:alpha/beta fold hydrolase n=1 Tax=Amycolatopsis sp. GM8 TaxID=2896530 RepID=UPI001F2A7568|nr:alpha/beta hydrolase [Amycolatopsis sp. GM8]